MELQQQLTAFAMLGATWVMWLLIGLSVIGLAIILERFYFYAVTRDDVARLSSELLENLRKRHLAEAQRVLGQSSCFEARMALAALASIPDGAAAAAERLQAAQQLARLQMESSLAFLGTVGANAPFLGLLGTVIGIIRAFHSLDESQGRVTAGLMADVGEALVATAIGILVALPAVAAFNFFQRLIKARLTRGAALGSHVIAHLLCEAEGSRARAREQE